MCVLAACSGGANSPAGTAGSTTGGSGSGGTNPAGTGGPTSGGTGGTTVGTGGATQGAAGVPGTGGTGIGGDAATGGSDGAQGGTVETGGSAGGMSGTGTGGTASGGVGAGGAAAGGAGTVDLFNGTDLTGFRVYKASSATSNNGVGSLLSTADALAVFKPENGTIHVYAAAAAANSSDPQYHYLLQTDSSFSKYNLSWEYKWGTKKFAPYQDIVKYPRDAGVLWHIHGDRTQVWPSSIEFQNKWGSTGDVYALYARCGSLGAPGNLTQFAEATAGGTMMTVDGSSGLIQHIRGVNAEMPGVGADAANGGGSDWNSCTLQVDANGNAVYIVNGKIVNRVLGVMDKTGKPVSSGYIAWQGEQAEVFYRNLRIQVLP